VQSNALCNCSYIQIPMFSSERLLFVGSAARRCDKLKWLIEKKRKSMCVPHETRKYISFRVPLLYIAARIYFLSMIAYFYAVSRFFSKRESNSSINYSTYSIRIRISNINAYIFNFASFFRASYAHLQLGLIKD